MLPQYRLHDARFPGEMYEKVFLPGMARPVLCQTKVTQEALAEVGLEAKGGTGAQT